MYLRTVELGSSVQRVYGTLSLVRLWSSSRGPSKVGNVPVDLQAIDTQEGPFFSLYSRSLLTSGWDLGSDGVGRGPFSFELVRGLGGSVRISDGRTWSLGPTRKRQYGLSGKCRDKEVL